MSKQDFDLINGIEYNGCVLMHIGYGNFLVFMHGIVQYEASCLTAAIAPTERLNRRGPERTNRIGKQTQMLVLPADWIWTKERYEAYILGLDPRDTK